MPAIVPGMTDSIELTGIYIYPVKSLRGIRLEEARIEHGRLVGDRTWLLVDREGWFMHIRDYPRVARIETRLTPTGISVSTDGMPPLSIDQPQDGLDRERMVHVQLWRRAAPTIPVSAAADAWFSRALGMPCHLMAFVPGAAALNVPDYDVNASLQDATPFHLTTEESLADLNGRMATSIPINRFRPNLVVRGAPPYAEDAWRTITVGDTMLRWIKPCMRCVATTTDHVTGERANQEPLRTLARYRRVGNEVSFGHYLVADRWGDRLRVGDRVTVVA